MKTKLNWWQVGGLIFLAGVIGWVGYREFTGGINKATVAEVRSGVGVDVLIEPEIATAAANTTTTLAVKMNTGPSALLGVQVVMNYSSNCIRPVVTAGSPGFLPAIVAGPKVENGKISFALGVGPVMGGSQGTGATIAQITTGPTRGTCVLDFDEVLVADAGYLNNVLRKAMGATIGLVGTGLGGGTIAVNPSLTPTMTPVVISGPGTIVMPSIAPIANPNKSLPRVCRILKKPSRIACRMCQMCK